MSTIITPNLSGVNVAKRIITISNAKLMEVAA